MPVAADALMIQYQRIASDVPAFKTSPPHAGSNPLDDQVALEFGDRADDHDDCAAEGTAGVDLLAEADELDVEPVELIEDVEEVLYRPGDPIRSPDQHDLEAAAPGIPHHGVEAGTLGLGAADHVGELLDDLETALGGHLPEVVELGFRVLIERRDPCV